MRFSHLLQGLFHHSLTVLVRYRFKVWVLALKVVLHSSIKVAALDVLTV